MSTIRMHDDTKKRFDNVGIYGNTADDIINTLIDIKDKYEKSMYLFENLIITSMNDKNKERIEYFSKEQDVSVIQIVNDAMETYVADRERKQEEMKKIQQTTLD